MTTRPKNVPEGGNAREVPPRLLRKAAGHVRHGLWLRLVAVGGGLAGAWDGTRGAW